MNLKSKGGRKYDQLETGLYIRDKILRHLFVNIVDPTEPFRFYDQVQQDRREAPSFFRINQASYDDDAEYYPSNLFLINWKWME